MLGAEAILSMEMVPHMWLALNITLFPGITPIISLCFYHIHLHTHTYSPLNLQATLIYLGFSLLIHGKKHSKQNKPDRTGYF